MTALRNKYIRDLAIRGKAKRTQEACTSFVADLARYYHRPPDLLSYDEVADWLFHLIRERKLASSSVNIAVNAVRFLYGVTLGLDLHELFANVGVLLALQSTLAAASQSEVCPHCHTGLLQVVRLIRPSHLPRCRPP